jgi:ABC-type amino acid transport substrate-binding protein
MKLTCLILEPVVLVADDLSAMIDEVAPGTDVAVVPSVAGALAAVRSGQVDLAFLDFPPEGFAETELGRALTASQATVVFLGHEAEAQALGLRYLERPIIGEAIASALTQVLSERPQSP